MNTTASEKFKRVCDQVWRDRDVILIGRGSLSGEAALMRAVYWRLCKTWGGVSTCTEGSYTGQRLFTYQRLVSIMLTQHAGPHYDGVPWLNELVRHYREESGQAAESRREMKAREG